MDNSNTGNKKQNKFRTDFEPSLPSDANKNNSNIISSSQKEASNSMIRSQEYMDRYKPTTNKDVTAASSSNNAIKSNKFMTYPTNISVIEEERSHADISFKNKSSIIDERIDANISLKREVGPADDFVDSRLTKDHVKAKVQVESHKSDTTPVSSSERNTKKSKGDKAAKNSNKNQIKRGKSERKNINRPSSNLSSLQEGYEIGQNFTTAGFNRIVKELITEGRSAENKISLQKDSYHLLKIASESFLAEKFISASHITRARGKKTLSKIDLETLDYIEKDQILRRKSCPVISMPNLIHETVAV